MQINLTAATLTKWATFGPGVIRRFHGWNANASAVYIQFHDASTMSGTQIIQAGDVPRVKSFLAAASNGFDYPHEDVPFYGPLVIALSTTEANYTAVGANAALDWTIEIDSPYDATTFTAAANIIGDLVTGADALVIWSDNNSAGGHRLLRVDYINSDGAARFLILDADPNVANGEGVAQWNFINGTATNTLLFGPGGRHVTRRDDNVVVGTIATPSGGTAHYGCVLAQSTTANISGITASAASKIRAFFI